MKKIISLVITGLMFVLFSSISFATTTYTDYAGAGEFSLQTTIHSSVAPSIRDTATIYTGCDGGCCCCPECDGEYEGTQILTNNPFSASSHQAAVTDGCIEIEQTYHDEFDNRETETDYYTYFNGTGTAESYVYASPGQGLSYQFANGTGSSYVSFSQIVYLDGVFDYGTTYGGGVWVCDPGYAGMVGDYGFYDPGIYYNSELDLYCYPVDGSGLSAFLFAETTDFFSLSSNLMLGSIEMNENIEAEGTSEYGFVATSYSDDIDFDFGMGLG